MKTINTLFRGMAVLVAFTLDTNTSADDLAAAAAKASTFAHRPIGASPHELEEFPWVLRRCSLPVNGGTASQAVFHGIIREQKKIHFGNYVTSTQ